MRLLFIHGSGCVKEGWYFQSKFFPDAAAIDLPGHPQGKPCATIDEYTDWLAGQVKEKANSGTVLVGHSMGGAVALLYALRHPGDLKGLVLMSTGARLKVHSGYMLELQEAINNKSIWKRLVEDTFRNLHPKVKDAVMKKQIDMGPALRLKDYEVCDKFDVLDKVEQLQLPTLVMCGSRDMLTPPKYTDYLGEKIKGAKKVVFDGAGHYIFMEKPDEVNQAISQFVAGIN